MVVVAIPGAGVVLDHRFEPRAVTRMVGDLNGLRRRQVLECGASGEQREAAPRRDRRHLPHAVHERPERRSIRVDLCRKGVPRRRHQASRGWARILSPGRTGNHGDARANRQHRAPQLHAVRPLAPAATRRRIEEHHQLVRQRRAQLLDARDPRRVGIELRHVDADADRRQLHRALALDRVHHILEVQVQILVAVGGQGGLVHRRAVGHHHQDLADLAAAAQAAVGPLHGLAVDVLLEHLVAHEESQRHTRAAPGNVGRLHHHVLERVEPARRIRVAVGRPLPRRLAAVPLARREAQDLAVHAAALEHPREDLDGQGGNLHRAAAHRARVIDQQRHHRAGEGRFGLLLERPRGAAAGDKRGQPRAVQLALVEIEPPLPRLARHQHPHQPLGQSRHHDAQRGQVLLERLAERLPVPRGSRAPLR